MAKAIPGNAGQPAQNMGESLTNPGHALFTDLDFDFIFEPLDLCPLFILIYGILAPCQWGSDPDSHAYKLIVIL